MIKDVLFLDCEKMKWQWQADERQIHVGWDFSYISDRWKANPTIWDYRKIVKYHLLSGHRLLDMGTGGGEFLLSLRHPHKITSVTEGFEPNIRLCRRRLEPLGITVFAVEDSSKLPIDDDKFDVVINRHEHYDLSEVSRVLKKGGAFITQQVGSSDCASLAERVNKAPVEHSDFSLAGELRKFKKNNFASTFSSQCYPELVFYDVGAIVYFAKVISWTFPDFSVDENFKQLCTLQKELEAHGRIATLQHRFIIVAINIKS